MFNYIFLSLFLIQGEEIDIFNNYSVLNECKDQELYKQIEEANGYLNKDALNDFIKCSSSPEFVNKSFFCMNIAYLALDKYEIQELEKLHAALKAIIKQKNSILNTTCKEAKKILKAHLKKNNKSK